MRVMLGMPDERGAILAIVALLLVAIFGMVALVVDVGALLVTRRRVVAAADSASLAAAQSCAREQGDGASQANTYATSNAGEASLLSFEPNGCEIPAASGTVAVSYGAPQEMYFAPILGLSDSVSVEASATAMWGPAHKAEPIPVTLNLDEPRACSDPCSFWLDPSVSDGDFADRDAGLVDLSPRQWEGDSCRRNVSSSLLGGWIDGTTRERVSLPAVPCAITRPNTNDLLGALVGQVGQDKVFPVAESFTDEGSGRGSFSVRGFAPLRIEGAALSAEEASDDCVPQPDPHDFLGPGYTLDISGPVLACLFDNNADSVEVELSKGDSCCSQPNDYVFDPATNTITWNEEETNNVRIEISWSRDAFTGDCGEQEVNGDEVCLAVSWQGPIVGGFEPLDGGVDDYGVRAVRLSD